MKRNVSSHIVLLAALICCTAASAQDQMYLLTSGDSGNSLVRIANGESQAAVPLGINTLYGVGRNVVVTLSVDQSAGSMPVLTVWDYDSGRRRGEFQARTPIWPRIATRNIVISEDDDRVWYLALSDQPPNVYLLVECSLPSGNCEEFELPGSMTRIRSASVIAFENGVVICDRGSTGIYLFRQGAFAEVPPHWRAAIGNSEREATVDGRPEYICASGHDAFARLSTSGDLIVLDQESIARLELSTVLNDSVPGASGRPREWDGLDVQSWQDEVWVFIMEPQVDNSGRETARVVHGIPSNDSSRLQRWLLPADASQFCALPDGIIRYVDSAARSIVDLKLETGESNVVATFSEDLQHLFLVPGP